MGVDKWFDFYFNLLDTNGMLILKLALLGGLIGGMLYFICGTNQSSQ